MAKGATVEVGGERSEGFYRPTVVTGVDHSMDLMTEETFGPVVPIMVVADEDEALRLANDTRFGLEELPAALAHLRKGRHFGKVVVEI